MNIVFVSIIIAFFASSCFCEIPSGHVMRVLSEIGYGWASSLEWLSGDSTAIWIETPPNNPKLARLQEWNGTYKRTLIPAGVLKISCGEVDSSNIVLASVMVPDTANWDKLSLKIYRERGDFESIPLPMGQIPGIATWDGGSDSIFYAICTKPNIPPTRFSSTFEGNVTKIERALPPGDELPIGRIPDDTTGTCLKTLFPAFPQIDSDSIPSNFMTGIVPQTDLDFVVEKGTLYIIDGEDSLIIYPPGTTSIEEIAWAQDGRRALISIFGHPSRVMLLMLVRPD